MGRCRSGPRACVCQIKTKYNTPQLFNLYTDIFLNLPVATIIDDAMIVLHGGLFKADGITIDHLQQIPRCVCGQGDAIWHPPFIGRLTTPPPPPKCHTAEECCIKTRGAEASPAPNREVVWCCRA